MKNGTVEERFWAKVNTTDGCWEWTACKTAEGYGRFLLESYDTHFAHRVSYALANGLIPEGMVIDHICQNKACVRPDHLRATTNKQNLENLSGPRADNTSGIRGVSWSKQNKKWCAQVGHNGKRYYAGCYDILEDAAEAVRNIRLDLHTHNELDRAA